MSTHSRNYLRTQRKRSGLRQDDIAFLLNLNGGYEISRFERMERLPRLDAAFGLQILFGTLPHELYPGLYTKVERTTRRRIRRLIAELEATPSDNNATYSRSVLAKTIERIDARRPRL